jgi:hypothetical protein
MGWKASPVSDHQDTADRLRAGFFARLARDPAAETFVVRGGARLRHLFGAASRQVGDVDLVCDEDRGAVEAALARTLADRTILDGVTFDPERYRVDVYDPASLRPGLRLSALGALSDGRLGQLAVDVVLGLALWPAPTWEPLGEGRALRMVAPSTMIGTKLRVISELGPRAWRPKDLIDVLCLLRRAPVSTGELGTAIEVAWSRAPEASSVRELLGGRSWWSGPRAAVRWRTFLDQSPAIEVLALDGAVDELRHRLAPLWRTCR